MSGGDTIREALGFLRWVGYPAKANAALAALDALQAKANAWDSSPTATPEHSDDQIGEAWREAYIARMMEAIEAEREAAALREAIRPFADAHAYKIAKGRKTKPPALGPKELQAAYEALRVSPAQPAEEQR